MSQPDLRTSFTKKSHRQVYPAVAPNNPAITAKGKIVVITGGSKGIGYAIANAFGLANASKIVLLARTRETLEEAQTLLKSIFVNTVFCYCSVDITNRKVMAGVFKSIRDTVGEPNVLVLGAAYLHPLKAGLDISDEDLDRSFDVNFMANINLVRIFFDPRTQYSETKIIINVSTVAAHTQQPNMSAYGASKAAFVHWLDHVQAEHRGVMRIHHMHPGIIRTDLLRDRGFGVGDWDWEDSDLPGAVAVWLASREAAFLTGRFIWANWDMNELKARAEEIQSSRYLLKIGLIGSPSEDDDKESTEDLFVFEEEEGKDVTRMDEEGDLMFFED